jgi:hypothetical protein
MRADLNEILGKDAVTFAGRVADLATFAKFSPIKSVSKVSIVCRAADFGFTCSVKRLEWTKKVTDTWQQF